MDPYLGILGPKMGPMFRDFFCQNPTHLGGTSPYSVSIWGKVKFRGIENKHKHKYSLNRQTHFT